MSSAGHVLAMIQTLRNNRHLRKTRDKFFTGLDKKIATDYRHRTKQDRAMSKEQLQKLRLRLIQENKQLLIKKIVILSVIVVAIVVFIIWINATIDLEKIYERYGF